MPRKKFIQVGWNSAFPMVASEPCKNQNLIYSISNPDAATPTLTGPASVKNAGYTFVLHPNMALQPLVITKDSPVKQRRIGQKQYELSDHLGNVRVVLSDIKEEVWNTATMAIEDYRPQLLSRADYCAFGSLLPGRNYSSDSYRFGFNGMEKNDEVYGSTGTSYDFGARLYDPRVGRWLSIDPLAGKFPGLTPYPFVGNMPIWMFLVTLSHVRRLLIESVEKRRPKPLKKIIK